MKQTPAEDSPSSGGGWVPDVHYANTFRVGYNAAEFVMEFARAYEGIERGGPARIVTSPAYAKAFGELIMSSVAEYEAQYGAIPAPPEGASRAL